MTDDKDEKDDSADDEKSEKTKESDGLDFETKEGRAGALKAVLFGVLASVANFEAMTPEAQGKALGALMVRTAMVATLGQAPSRRNYSNHSQAENYEVFYSMWNMVDRLVGDLAALFVPIAVWHPEVYASATAFAKAQIDGFVPLVDESGDDARGEPPQSPQPPTFNLPESTKAPGEEARVMWALSWNEYLAVHSTMMLGMVALMEAAGIDPELAVATADVRRMRRSMYRSGRRAISTLGVDGWNALVRRFSALGQVAFGDQIADADFTLVETDVPFTPPGGS